MNAHAVTLVEQLRQHNQSLVLAESCTCGLIAATIGGVPGASVVFCGSSVVYRASTKMNWLGVPADLLSHYSPESEQTSESLARSVLERTPEATIAAAITGHLGPNAPLEKDGQVFACIVGVQRVREQRQHRLQTIDRESRQIEATDWLLQWITMYLRS